MSEGILVKVWVGSSLSRFTYKVTRVLVDSDVLNFNRFKVSTDGRGT